MSSKTAAPRRGRFGRVTDVRFVEVEFEAPAGTRMVIEVEGGLRLLVADEEAVELAAELLKCLARPRKGGRK